MIFGKKKISVLWLFFSCALPVMGQQLQTKDSITMAISPAYDSVSKAHRFFFGESYRRLWAAPVRVRIIDLQKEHGGMTVLQLGGGMETRSIRLKDASGREWVLRTVQKYPERKLPENLKKTIVKDIVQDQIATGHPFSALIVPPLAEALGIPHANPEIVYVGDDPALGEYRKDFANGIYLIEERSPLGYEKSDNTAKVQEKVQEDNDTHVAQKLVLRSRLLDFILGDYDKHEDNWRFVKVEDKEKDEKVYVPVPRDRDKVFYSTSGLFPWILSHQWLKANIQPYKEEIRAVEQWNIYQRYFDRYFLNALSEKDWKEEIAYVQQKITTPLLVSAMKLMPEQVNAINGNELLRILIARRDNLNKSAMTYYHFLAQNVDVAASDKKEYFEIDHKKNGNIALSIHNIKKTGGTGRNIYHRTFDQSQTKEIRLYGMGEDDVFEIKGNSKSSIITRMIGGEGKDSFDIDQDLKERGKIYIYDRLDEQGKLPPSSLAKLRLSNDTAVNQYNKTSFAFDRFGPLFRLNYNVDQGIQAGVGLLWEKQGFRRTPYADKQEFWIDYSTGRKSFILTYDADFKKVIGENNFKINANFLGPNNLSNFFGFGNDTGFIQDDSKGMPYYRNRYDYLTADFQLYRTLNKWTIGAGIATEYYTSSRTGNASRFLNDFNLSDPDEDVFNDRLYLGLIADVKYDTRDNIAVPTKGIYWDTEFSANKQVNEGYKSYGKVKTEFRYYLNPGHSGFVIANRLGGGTTFGSPAFFQDMQLGGVHNLRGFHTNRFTGKSMLYYDLDLRMKLFDFTSYIVPGSLGLMGFNDVGRVWQPGQSSDTWHYGYGGGIYIVPADLILIQAAVGFSKESTMPYISIGFNF